MTVTQKNILKSAAKLFREQGYSKVSLRQIAGDASVEPSIIIRHFGSKEELFLHAISIEASETISAIPLKSFGEILINQILLDSDDPTSAVYAIGILLRASENERLQRQVRATIEDLIVRPIAEKIKGPDVALRAKLVATQILGLLVELFIMQDEKVRSERAKVVSLYGSAIQRLVED